MSMKAHLACFLEQLVDKGGKFLELKHWFALASITLFIEVFHFVLGFLFHPILEVLLERWDKFLLKDFELLYERPSIGLEQFFSTYFEKMKDDLSLILCVLQGHQGGKTHEHAANISVAQVERPKHHGMDLESIDSSCDCFSLAIRDSKTALLN